MFHKMQKKEPRGCTKIKFKFYCDELSIETKKFQLHTRPPSTQLRYILFHLILFDFDLKKKVV